MTGDKSFSLATTQGDDVLDTPGAHVLSEVTLTRALGPTQDETMASDTLGP